MELWFNQGSPFARKVRILAREKGLLSRIREIPTSVSPVDMNEDLAHHNPLIKIPMLLLHGNESLYDSRVICEYLDTLHGGEASLPAAGPARFKALRQIALCDGILDAAVLCRYELALRPTELRWNDWVDGQRRKIFGGLAQLEAEVDEWSDDFGMPQIGAVCTAGYLDFRFTDWAWRAAYPRLAEWQLRIAQRPSVLATRPGEPTAAPMTGTHRHAGTRESGTPSGH